jgi:hypothetical protein
MIQFELHALASMILQMCEPHGALELRDLKHPQGRFAVDPLDKAEALEGREPKGTVEPLLSSGAVRAVLDDQEVPLASEFGDALSTRSIVKAARLPLYTGSAA